MAKVLHEIDHGREFTHLMLSPSLRPCPLALADRDRRAKLERRCLACRRSTCANDEPIESNIETAGQKEILVAVGATE